MGSVFGGGGGSSNAPPIYTSVQLNVSVNTLPIPIIWGTGKLGTNLIEYTDFQKHKQNKGKGGGGGKGGGFTYSATVELAVCEGVIDGAPVVLVNTNDQETPANLGMSFIPGTYPEQAPWSYMTIAHPEDAFGYPGTFLLVAENYNLGSGAAAPNINLITVRSSLATAGDNHFLASWYRPNDIQASTYPVLYAAFSTGIPTSDMALVIEDMLTNAQYGVPGFSSSSINTDTLLSSGDATTTGDMALQTYLRALGIGMCPVLNGQETAQSILGRWLQLCNCAPVWSGKSLKFIPYGDEEITANGVTYLPNLTVVYDLDDDDFVGDSSADPVEITRTDPADAFNVVRVEVTSADGFFSYMPIEARDQNAIEKRGAPRIAPTVTAHEIIGTQAGALIAQLILQQGLYWRNTATFKLAETMCLLEPMDMITLTDPNIGLVATPYRILAVEESDTGELTITAQEYRVGVSTATAYAKQVAISAPPDSGALASNVNIPIIFQPPTSLASPQQIWIAVCGGGGAYDPNWGGCQIWVSVDDDNYIMAGTVTTPARMGTLTANFAAYGGTNPDNTNTLSVDLSESAGALNSGSSADAAAARTLCYVDGELLSFETATLTVATATNEAHSVPAVAPYNVNATHEGTFIANTSVAYAAGGTLTLVGSSPTVGQYTCVDGLYGFNAADAGAAIKITYTYGSASHFALTGLYRGQFGSTPGAHLSGTQFARLDNAIFEFDLPADYIGVTVYIKFVSFNIFNNGLQSIADVSAYTFTPTGIPAPSGFAAFGVTEQLNISPATYGAALEISCTPPGDSNLIAQFSYQPPGSSVWFDAPVPFGQFMIITRILSVSGTYNVRARFVTQDLAQSGPWVTTTAIVAIASAIWTRDDTNNIGVTSDDTNALLITVHD